MVKERVNEVVSCYTILWQTPQRVCFWIRYETEHPEWNRDCWRLSVYHFPCLNSDPGSNLGNSPDCCSHSDWSREWSWFSRQRSGATEPDWPPTNSPRHPNWPRPPQKWAWHLCHHTQQPERPPCPEYQPDTEPN